MSDTDTLNPLRQFHAFTESLLELARANEWQAFEAKAAERERLIEAINDNQFLIRVAEAGLADSMRAEIAEIQTLNDEITHLAEATKADIAAQLKQQNHQDKAIKAYKP